MPETSPFHKEESLSEAQEQILTPEDRARLDQLFLETKENSSLFAGYRNQESVEARLRWRDEGRKAVAYLLEIINNTAHLATYESYQYVCLLDLCASSDDAQKIGALLLRDDVTFLGDRSFKSKFLRILERIGTPENTDQLVQSAERCLDAPYGSLLKKEDSMDVISVLWSIGLRIDTEYAENEENEQYQEVHRQLGNAGQRIRENLRDRTGQEITDYEEQLLGESLWYREAAFASLFEVQEEQESDDSHDPYDYESDERNMSWEDEQDDEMEDSYRENKFAEIESRLEVIKRLRHEIKKEQKIKEEPEDDEGKFLRRHWLEYREDNPSPYAPTLGIEIEIRERTLLPPEAKNWIKDEKIDFVEPKRKLFERTEKLGVGRGLDAFWEFAHNPVRHYTTLSREVQALMDMGLINKQYRKHSLHITLGGVTSKGPGGKGAFVLARALESTGWGVTSGRIMRPYLLKRGAWTYKGRAGVKERDASEMQLNTSRGIEIRTMQVQGLTGLDRLLRSSYLLGTALRAYQERGLDDPIVSVDAGEEMRETLAKIWLSFAQETKTIFHKYGLADPSIIWKVPDRDHEEGEAPTGDFVPFAALLDEARQHPQSLGAEFVAEMRGLIIKTRKEIADVIYQKPAL